MCGLCIPEMSGEGEGAAVWLCGVGGIGAPGLTCWCAEGPRLDAGEYG